MGDGRVLMLRLADQLEMISCIEWVLHSTKACAFGNSLPASAVNVRAPWTRSR